MKTVITYGTFDLFHVGHLRLLKRLSKLGERLVVGLSTDEFNKVKGKKVIIPYAERREVLMGCRYVDEVFPETSWEQKRDDIIRESADIFAIGDDWAGEFDDLQDIVSVLYLPRTKDVSTPELKTVLREISDEKLREVRHVASHLMRLINEME